MKCKYQPESKGKSNRNKANYLYDSNPLLLITHKTLTAESPKPTVQQQPARAQQPPHTITRSDTEVLAVCVKASFVSA